MTNATVNPKWLAGYEEGKRAEREMLLARLANPDEALVEAVISQVSGTGVFKSLRMRDVTAWVAPICRALALTLGQEGENTDG